MCLRLRPQGHENSVAFDGHCILLEVFFIVLVFILVLFCILEGTQTHKKPILKPPSESQDPKG